MLFFLDRNQRKRSLVAGDDKGVAEGSLQAQPGELGQNNSFHLRFTATTKKNIFLSVSIVTDPGPMLKLKKTGVTLAVASTNFETCGFVWVLSFFCSNS